MENNCDACEGNIAEHTISFDDESWNVCSKCKKRTRAAMMPWYKNISEEHFRKARTFLKSLDGIWCVYIDDTGGEITVHTPYYNSLIVEDVIENMGFVILSFSIVSYKDDYKFDCVEKHGSCVEITLEYNSQCQEPLPIESTLDPFCASWVEGSDKKIFNLQSNEGTK